MKVDVVIGANYGDEGKGLFTEFLSGSYGGRTVVALANGGSQRGHTVNDPVCGRRVFHHFGSGTLAGVPTYFAKSYLLNPMQFVREKDELEDLFARKKPGAKVVSYRDPGCFVQLPVDIALNWHIERCRGERRHGSVGCGIWETTRRIKFCRDPLMRPTLNDIRGMGYGALVRLLKDRSYEYAKARCREEGVPDRVDLLDMFLSDGFADHYIADAKRMLAECAELPFGELLGFDRVVFENGQGLMLDQFYGRADADRTTPSYTGSIGIARLLRPFGRACESVNLNYVSRTYLTRHGAGRFDAECPGMKFEDRTNVYNEWQEGLRFGELDADGLLRRIDVDFRRFEELFGFPARIGKNIAFTHCNEVAAKEIDAKKAGFGRVFVSSTDMAKDIEDLSLS